MKLEEQVVSLELAKRLKELGAGQDSLFYWVTTTWDKEFYLVASETFDVLNGRTSGSVYQDSGHEGDSWDVKECYAAFTVAELGELLPAGYVSEIWRWSSSEMDRWHCYEVNGMQINDKDVGEGRTEADARGKMLVYVLEREGKKE